MKLRSHLIASAVAGVALYPRRPLSALLTLIAGVAVDFDHILLYALRSGDWNPLGARAYDRRRHGRTRRGDTRPRYGSLRSPIHRPLLSLPIIWLLALAFPRLRPLAAGATLHLAMDTPYQRYNRTVWERAGFRCERCGMTGVSLDVYFRRPPHFGGDPWALENRELRCPQCEREILNER